MKPVTYHLTQQQIDRLRAESKQTGLTVAELIRRAIDAYLTDELHRMSLSTPPSER